MVVHDQRYSLSLYCLLNHFAFCYISMMTIQPEVNVLKIFFTFICFVQLFYFHIYSHMHAAERSEDNLEEFCPWTMWDPGIELRLSGLGAGTLTH